MCRIRCIAALLSYGTGNSVSVCCPTQHGEGDEAVSRVWRAWNMSVYHTGHSGFLITKSDEDPRFLSVDRPLTRHFPRDGISYQRQRTVTT
jgi:hypothetical protein